MSYHYPSPLKTPIKNIPLKSRQEIIHQNHTLSNSNIYITPTQDKPSIIIDLTSNDDDSNEEDFISSSPLVSLKNKPFKILDATTNNYNKNNKKVKSQGSLLPLLQKIQNESETMESNNSNNKSNCSMNNDHINIINNNDLIDTSIYSVKIPSVHLYIINDTIIQISIALSRKEKVAFKRHFYYIAKTKKKQ
ncbi:hypothetical protein BCR36DRAFT_367215 [Piromyces finnis]|uniref:Uncharacterized protein n=1 Tax=Piromyces finnis TaxID=1754191 RepID=A0A1Y1VIB9_9FUNG|nr:hypothetical protein BCR36DRAFT_367215 [Piromyces finnis]|eukprot:ORX57147.1 hypothetical protein BCR36DRAFT_367215 [Piromyces finnis]